MIIATTTEAGSPSTWARPSPVLTTRPAYGRRRSSLILWPSCRSRLLPAQAALAWVAQQPGVTTVIPGARTVAQAKANAAAGELPPLGAAFMAGVEQLYDRELRAQIHDRW